LRLRADDAFPAEAGEFEIEEEREFEIRDGEIAGHLGDVSVRERGDNLGIDDHEVVDDEVGDESADELAFVVNRKRFLLGDGVAPFGEFDDEGVFVELFVETGLEGVEHLHRGTDDGCAEFCVDQVGHSREKEFFGPRITRMSRMVLGGREFIRGIGVIRGQKSRISWLTQWDFIPRPHQRHR